MTFIRQDPGAVLQDHRQRRHRGRGRQRLQQGRVSFMEEHSYPRRMSSRAAMSRPNPPLMMSAPISTAMRCSTVSTTFSAVRLLSVSACIGRSHLWVAHTHMMGVWDSSPRIAFMSPERGSGKTRALEVTALLVPRPCTRSIIAWLLLSGRSPTRPAFRLSFTTKLTRCSETSSRRRPTFSRLKRRTSEGRHVRAVCYRRRPR